MRAARCTVIGEAAPAAVLVIGADCRLRRMSTTVRATASASTSAGSSAEPTRIVGAASGPKAIPATGAAGTACRSRGSGVESDDDTVSAARAFFETAGSIGPSSVVGSPS